MRKRVAIIVPGQGAQFVGMEKSLFESFTSFRQTFEEADTYLNYPLSTLISKGPSETLRLTRYSQLALYVMGVATWRVMKQIATFDPPHAVAGLSLGEYTALTVAGKLPFVQGLKLVHRRALSMHACSLKFPGTMAVCLGLSAEEVKQTIDPCKGVWIANLNCPGQVVISGTFDGVNEARERLKSNGAKRIVDLQVSGPFHSELMKEAQEELTPHIESTSLLPGDSPIVMNVSGEYVSNTPMIKRHLIDQVTSPVLWEKGIREMVDRGVELFIELGPGKTLKGLNQKMGLSAPTHTIERAESLDALIETVEV